MSGELADEAVTEKIEIADRIEDLVLHEFVFVAQAVLVEHAKIIEHDRVVEVAAEREIARAHRLEIAHEAEGARAAHFLQERGRREIHRRLLRAALEHRMVELDLEVDLETVERPDLGPLV